MTVAKVTCYPNVHYDQRALDRVSNAASTKKDNSKQISNGVNTFSNVQKLVRCPSLQKLTCIVKLIGAFQCHHIHKKTEIPGWFAFMQ